MTDNRHEHYSLNHRDGHRRHHHPEQGHEVRGHHHGHGGHRGHHEHHENHENHGHGGHHGYGRHGLHSSRKLSSSDLQLILLALLANRPSHGYELIKALEDHSQGLYVPSPGMIYPALTFLEEIGMASFELEGNKKRYTLSEAGRIHFEQNKDGATRILDDMQRIGAQMARQAMAAGSLREGSEFEITNEALESARLVLRKAQHKKQPYTAEETQSVVEILNRAAVEISNLLEKSEAS